MSDMDLGNIIFRLAKAYPGTTLDGETVSIYLEELAGYSPEDVTGAARSLLRSSRFFPTIADFVSAIEGPQVTPEDALLMEAEDALDWVRGATGPERLAARAEGGDRLIALELGDKLFPSVDGMSAESWRFARGEFRRAYVRRVKAARQAAQAQRRLAAGEQRQITGGEHE